MSTVATSADPPAPRPVPESTPEEDPAREAVIRDPGLADAPGGPDRGEPPAQPDPDAPGRGLDETDDPIPEPNEPA